MSCECQTDRKTDGQTDSSLSRRLRQTEHSSQMTPNKIIRLCQGGETERKANCAFCRKAKCGRLIFSRVTVQQERLTMRIMDGRLLPGNERKGRGEKCPRMEEGGEGLHPPPPSSSSVNWRRSKLIQRTRGSYQSDTRRKEGHLGGPDRRTGRRSTTERAFGSVRWSK